MQKKSASLSLYLNDFVQGVGVYFWILGNDWSRREEGSDALRSRRTSADSRSVIRIVVRRPVTNQESQRDNLDMMPRKAG